MTQARDDGSPHPPDETLTPEEREERFMEMYLWLDHELGDRDQKDLEALEASTHIFVR
jgi:hypothetical protein